MFSLTLSVCLLIITSITPTLVLAQQQPPFQLATSQPLQNRLEQVVVTATREEKSLSKLSESVGVLTERDLKNIAPSHPAEALNRIPGVHINNLGGEGHMTAIRQPITTSGVYLFLEDGIPTRPSGFFNHNGLYEINIPQSARIEVVKGPGSALYGSDAIGGVINVVTKASPSTFEAASNLELGSYGWRRGLLSAGSGLGQDSGFRVDFNYTDNEGYREEAEYDRQSLSFRLDSQINDKWRSKWIVSTSDINQSGVSALEYDDYSGQTKKNLYHSDIGFRQVEALRVSAEFEYQPNNIHLFTITPFYRNNTMEMMPSWMVTYDPNIRQYDFESFGAMLKYRLLFAHDRGEFIAGVDTDQTPSSYDEEAISVTQENDIYSGYARTGQRHYLFDAEQSSLSPYLHVDFQLAEKWRFNAGVRYDDFEVDYENFLPADPADFSHRRPDSTELRYSKTSPKLGLIYQFADAHQSYLSVRHAFRAPTVGALFRPGSSQQSTQLKPVKSVSQEVGLRGRFAQVFDYELAIYDMQVEDDIVSVIRGPSRFSVNAGETEHQGIELGFDWRFASDWQLGMAGSFTSQTYENFSYVFFSRDCFCNQEINFAGNDVAKAPKHTGNAHLSYTPSHIEGLRIELEWERLGAYFTDETNTMKYEGHDLVNVRVNYRFSEKIETYARVSNLADELYSTYTSNQVNDPDLSYRPGQPRSVFVGVHLTF